jgi:uncharacterized membrane protein
MKNRILFWWGLFLILLAMFTYLLRDGIWIYSDANASGELLKDFQLKPIITYFIIFLLALSLDFIIWLGFLLAKWFYKQYKAKGAKPL